MLFYCEAPEMFLDLSIFLQNIVDWKLDGDGNRCTQVQSK